MENGYLYIIEANTEQINVLRNLSQLKWNRKKKWWEGIVCAELLNRLSDVICLPESIRTERDRLNAIQKAVDEERIRPVENLKPLVQYPVKEKLYAHQIRAANMCLLTFELIEPQQEDFDGES